MRRILRTTESGLDYAEIWTYIATDNPAAADSLIRRFDANLAMLAASPGVGRARPEFTPDLRSFPVDKYILFYLPLPDGIHLIRVLHGARDISPDYFLPRP